MSNKERSKREHRDSKRAAGKNDRVDIQSTYRGDDYRSTNLRDSPMMAHLVDALEQGEDIGP